MRVLLVEDDELLGDGLQAGLKLSNFNVVWVQNLQEARYAISIGLYDTMVLDIGLPDGSGLDLLKELRKEKNNLPVLILTAKDSLQDKVEGLNQGGDDYLVKPFELDELVARLYSLLRRSQQRAENTILYKHINFDPIARTVHLNGDLIEVPHREMNLLEKFLGNQGRVLSRLQLEESLYGWSAEVESNAIEVHIHHLRKRFGSDIIKTVRGIGYIMKKDGK